MPGERQYATNAERQAAYRARHRERELPRQELLAGLKQRANPAYSNAVEIAMIYAALGENSHAMTWLLRGYDERFNPGVLLRPGFDSLRADAQFRELVRRVGLAK